VLGNHALRKIKSSDRNKHTNKNKTISIKAHIKFNLFSTSRLTSTNTQLEIYHSSTIFYGPKLQTNIYAWTTLVTGDPIDLFESLLLLVIYTNSLMMTIFLHHRFSPPCTSYLLVAELFPPHADPTLPNIVVICMQQPDSTFHTK